MKYHVIADEDTVLGFRFTGIGGDAVATPDEARRKLAEAVADPSIGVIIMTEQAADTIGEDISRILYQSERPILVRIPGPEGPSATRRRLQDLIEEAVGIKV